MNDPELFHALGIFHVALHVPKPLLVGLEHLRQMFRRDLILERRRLRGLSFGNRGGLAVSFAHPRSCLALAATTAARRPHQ